MHRRLPLVVLLATVLVTAPSALAHGAHHTEEAGPEGDEVYVFLHDTEYGRNSNEVCVPPHYYPLLCQNAGLPTIEGPMPPVVEVYQETNGCDGLQRSAVDCAGDSAPEPADDRIV